jgi:hypothetical protein
MDLLRVVRQRNVEVDEAAYQLGYRSTAINSGLQVGEVVAKPQSAAGIPGVVKVGLPHRDFLHR